MDYLNFNEWDLKFLVILEWTHLLDIFVFNHSWVTAADLTSRMCVSESAQLVPKPEERHGAERDGHTRQTTARHAERLRHQLLQVFLRTPPLSSFMLHAPLANNSSDVFLQAAQQGRQPPGDVQERHPWAAVATLPRANQAATAEEAAGKPRPQPQSLSVLHWYPAMLHFALFFCKKKKKE